MGTYANYTCFKCQIRRPAHYMKQTEVTVKSGSSGWGVSFNPSRKNSARISAPRSYHSIRKKWLCNDAKACHNPKYYIELEARLAAENAEKIRLQKIEDQKTDTKDSIKKGINSYLVPSTISRRASVLKPLINDAEIRTAVEGMKTRFTEKMRTESTEKIISEIIRQGNFSARIPLKSSADLKFKIPSNALLKDIVSKIFMGVEKEKKKSAAYRWSLYALRFLFCVATAGTGLLLLILLQIRQGNKPARIYKREILKVAKLVSQKIKKTPLSEEVVMQVKSDKKMAVLPHFKECRPEIISNDIWKSATVKKSTVSGNRQNSKSENKDTQTRREVYESDEFFDMCMFLLMVSVANADGDQSEDEMYIMESKYSVSPANHKLMSKLLKIEGSFDWILKTMATLFAGNTAALEMVINNLMAVAEADGEVSQSEVREIHLIGKKLGLSKSSVQNIITNQNPMDTNDESVRYFDEEFFPEFEEVMGQE